MGRQLAQVADVADVIALALFIPMSPPDFPPRNLFHLLECSRMEMLFSLHASDVVASPGRGLRKNS